MQLDMNLFTTGQKISCQRSRQKSREIIHYVSTLLPHLKKKLLKKLNTYHRPKTLREAMDVTMDFKVEHQITQAESYLGVMETCYKESTIEETHTTKVQMRSQTQKQGYNQQRSQLQFQTQQYSGQKNFQRNKNQNKLGLDQVTNLSTARGNNQNYGDKSKYQGHHQPGSKQMPEEQPRIQL